VVLSLLTVVYAVADRRRLCSYRPSKSQPVRVS